MPSESLAKREIEFTMKVDDPSLYYDIVEKIGVGGFARVFKVKRKSDGAICALKFVEPKNQEQINSVINEVGIMLMCKENDAILKCYECFDFKGRIWIFLEMMDGGALTPMLEDLSGQHNEDFCKFICLRVLQGLKYLHDRHILPEISSLIIFWSAQRGRSSWRTSDTQPSSRLRISDARARWEPCVGWRQR